jgi:hypothetical protein
MDGWQQIALDDRPRCCYLILDILQPSHGESDIRIALNRFIVSRGGVPPWVCV